MKKMILTAMLGAFLMPVAQAGVVRFAAKSAVKTTVFAAKTTFKAAKFAGKILF